MQTRALDAEANLAPLLAVARAEEREVCAQIAFRYECDCPQTMLCGHRVAAGKIAAALRARRDEG